MQLKQVVTESDNSDLVRSSKQLKVFIYISFDRMKSTMKQQVNKICAKNMSNFSSRQGIYVDTIETCDDCNQNGIVFIQLKRMISYTRWNAEIKLSNFASKYRIYDHLPNCIFFKLVGGYRFRKRCAQKCLCILPTYRTCPLCKYSRVSNVYIKIRLVKCYGDSKVLSTLFNTPCNIQLPIYVEIKPQ